MTETNSSHRLLIETIDGYVDEEVADETIRDAYERITDGFFAVDEDWKITYINRKATGLLGAERSEVLGDCLWDSFPDSRGTVFHEKSKVAMQEQRPVSYEGYYGYLDKWFQVNAYPSEDGLSVYFRDVTERKGRESKLERYKAFVEGSSDVITLLDGSGTVLYNSPSVERILGHGQEERVGEKAFEYVHPDDRTRVTEKFGEVANEEKEVGDVQFRLQKGNGEYVWVEGVGGKEVSAEVEGYVVNVRDISDKKKRERELERYEAFVESTTDIISHVDEQGEILYQSPSVERLLGHDQTERVARASSSTSILKTGTA